MPIYNVTVDDVSPLLIYSDGWIDTNKGDAAYVEYANSTFHATQTPGASMTLQFFGTAIYVAGAKRANHDQFTVTVDDSSFIGNSFASDPGLFQQVLFSQTGLTSGYHTLVMTDNSTRSDRPFLDIDYVEITTGDDSSKTTSVDTTFDDDAAQYSSGWDDSPNNLSSYYFNKTMHRTNTVNASATFTFTGSAISVFGATSSNHGEFAVSVDGGAQLPLNGTAPAFRAQTLLYYLSGLTNTTHAITLTNLASDSSVFFDVDYFVVSQYFAGTSSNGTASSSGDGNVASTSHTNAAAFAGGFSAGAVALILGAFGLFYWLRRRKRRSRAVVDNQEDGKVDLVGDGTTASAPYATYVPAWTAADGSTTSAGAPWTASGSVSSPSLPFSPQSAYLVQSPGAGTIASVPTPQTGKRHRGNRERRGDGATTPSDSLSPTMSSPATNYSRDPTTRYRHAHRRNISETTAGTGAVSTATGSGPYSSEPETDAGPAFDPYQAPPPQYGQVFQPPGDPDRLAKTPAFTMTGPAPPAGPSASTPQARESRPLPTAP